MNLLFLLLLVSFSHASDTKPFASLIKSHQPGYMAKELVTGDFLISSNDEDFVFSPYGMLVKKVLTNATGLAFTNHRHVLGRYLTNVQLYSLDGESKKVAVIPVKPIHTPTILRNGNILFHLAGNLIQTYNSQGKLQHQIKLAGAPNKTAEFRDDTLVVDINPGKKLYFLTKDLKLKKEVNLDCSPRFYGHGELVVCENFEGKLYFLDSNGETKYSTTPGFVGGHLELSNSSGIFMKNDGFMYFMDHKGEVTNKYEHGTSLMGDIVPVTNKIFAYRNSTEIVFVNLEGKEVGTYKLPAGKDSKYFSLTGSDKGTIVLLHGSGQVDFITVNH